MPSGDIYTTDKQNGNMPAEYMQEERRSSALERTLNKSEQHDLMNSVWLANLALTLNSSIIVR